MSDAAPQRILIVGPSWVGDMVMAQTLFRTLRQENPDCLIDVLAPDWSRPLLARMPEVRQALTLPFGHGELRLGERRAFGRSLQGQYDQALVLPNSFKSALIPWWARIPRRIGWRGEMRYGLLNDMRLLDKAAYPLMVQRFVALGLPGDAPVPAAESIKPPLLLADMNGADRTLMSLGLKRNLPVLGLCPGAEFGPSKRWPDAYYAAVAREKLEAGWQVWIFGSPKDQEVAEAIRRQVPEKYRARVHLLAGRTSLEEAVDIMALVDAVISNDSGLMHIAAALHRPLVAVYGSTSPGFTPPLGERVEIVRLGLECSPCFQRECPLGHLNCLNQLEPPLVSAALARVTGEA